MSLALLKISGEVATKSPPVRRRMIRSLRQNLFMRFPNITISGGWDHLFVESENSIVDDLAHIPGIAKVHEVLRFDFKNLTECFEILRPLYADQIEGKTFCVRVKRSGNHDFRSPEAERFLGMKFLQLGTAKGVKMKNPDVTVSLEIHSEELLVLIHSKMGAGGFPVGSSGRAALLLSGGFDSCVAAEMMMKKGVALDFIFFDLGGESHSNGVLEIASFLAKRFSAGYDGSFFAVDFRPVVAEILRTIPSKFRGVVLKRMMIRLAQQVGKKSSALITGESLAQVSSQTFDNLAVIESVAKKPLFRPLFAFSKNEIIARAEAIGVAEFCRKMPEFCAVISKKPTTAAKKAEVEALENAFDFEILKTLSITKTPFSELSWEKPDIETRHFLLQGEWVIDLREPEEIPENPLKIDEKLEIPFEEIHEKFSELDPKKSYFFFCERGVVSRSVAEELSKKGHQNVGVFVPG